MRHCDMGLLPWLGTGSGGGGASGLTVVANWAARPLSASEGDLLLTEDDGLYWQWREVSGDGQWLPAEVTYGGTLAYRQGGDAELCRLRLADASFPATWLNVGATKSAGNPLAIAGGAGLQYLAAELPASAGGLYLLVVIAATLGAGEAWVAYMGGEGGGGDGCGGGLARRHGALGHQGAGREQ